MMKSFVMKYILLLGVFTSSLHFANSISTGANIKYLGDSNADQVNCNSCNDIPYPGTLPNCTSNYTTPYHMIKLTVRKGSRTSICFGLKHFTKYVKVFDLYFVATSSSQDFNLLHAASILYQLLDNDDDGAPDNSRMYESLVKMKATMTMYSDEGEKKKMAHQLHSCGGVAELLTLQASEVSITPDKVDASLIETFSLVFFGYNKAYPEIFDGTPGSKLSCMMDCARGGHFLNIPEKYPVKAWFTYANKTCDYNCMVMKYMYWGMMTYIGIHGARKSDEWRPNTCSELRSRDLPLYSLLSNSSYRFPVRLPVVGVYPASEKSCHPCHPRMSHSNFITPCLKVILLMVIVQFVLR